MKNNYILIDYENVQPKGLEVLEGHEFTLIVFVGANQSKIPSEFAVAMQGLGERASYRQISGNGPNALDFHIAFYLGEFASSAPKALFHIISRDKGFDPLIEHLKARKVRAFRYQELSEIPFVKKLRATSPEDRLEIVSANLRSRGKARPKTVSKLNGTISAIFKKTIDDKEVGGLIGALERRGDIHINGQAVTYGPGIIGH